MAKCCSLAKDALRLRAFLALNAKGCIGHRLHLARSEYSVGTSAPDESAKAKPRVQGSLGAATRTSTSFRLAILPPAAAPIGTKPTLFHLAT